MKLCPICGVELRPRVVYEVEVDTCPSAAACGLTAASYKSSSPKSGSTGRSTTAINAIESGRRSGVRKRRRKVFSIF
jgi:Zn-finger nucleic acid-binding protein